MENLNLLRNIMRLLTPEEIQELTTISAGANKTDLTTMMDAYIKRDLGENVLSFSEFKERNQKENEAGPEAIEVENTETTEKIEEGPEAQKKGVVFILDIKRKMAESQRRLKEREIRDLYDENANFDLDQEKANKDDMSKSSKVGVLINKKQF